MDVYWIIIKNNKMENKKQPYWKKKGFKSQYEYQKLLAQRKGFKTPRDYRVSIGTDIVKDEWRVKDIYNECDPTAVPIPFAPDYYITPMGVIWCYSKRRGEWLVISQQTHKSGYCAFQPYIDGKRRVKYVHRALCAAFYGDRDNNYEAHHINYDRQDNTLDNVVWMAKDEHRSMLKKKNWENL